jgi:hypothetical protein
VALHRATERSLDRVLSLRRPRARCEDFTRQAFELQAACGHQHAHTEAQWPAVRELRARRAQVVVAAYEVVRPFGRSPEAVGGVTWAGQLKEVPLDVLSPDLRGICASWEDGGGAGHLPRQGGHDGRLRRPDGHGSKAVGGPCLPLITVKNTEFIGGLPAEGR